MKPVLFIVALLLNSEIFSQQDLDSLFNNQQLFEKVKILPNPTSELIFIQNNEAVNSYKLVNKMGQILQEGKHPVQILSLLEQESGYYYLFLEINGYFKRYIIYKQ